MTPFPVHDAPEALTIVQHLKAQTLFADACAAMQGQTCLLYTSDAADE